MQEKKLREIAIKILDSSLKSVNPYYLISEQVKREDSRLVIGNRLTVDLKDFGKIVVCGAGKGTAPMARAFEELVGKYLYAGSVIVKYDHLDNLRRIHLYEASILFPIKIPLKQASCC